MSHNTPEHSGYRDTTTGEPTPTPNYTNITWREDKPTTCKWTRTKVAEVFSENGNGDLGRGFDNIAKAINAALAASERGRKGFIHSIEEARGMFAESQKQLAAERETVRLANKIMESDRLAIADRDDQLAAEQENNFNANFGVRQERDALLQQLAAERDAAKKLCELYFNIAAKAIGEDEVRRKRDTELAKAKEGK